MDTRQACAERWLGGRCARRESRKPRRVVGTSQWRSDNLILEFLARDYAWFTGDGDERPRKVLGQDNPVDWLNVVIIRSMESQTAAGQQAEVGVRKSH